MVFGHHLEDDIYGTNAVVEAGVGTRSTAIPGASNPFDYNLVRVDKLCVSNSRLAGSLKAMGLYIIICRRRTDTR